MHEHRLAWAEPARLARCGDAAALALALQASRRDTLATFAAFEAALPGLVVAQHAELNPPLWELGHIGWFQSWWLGRYPACADGMHADPDSPRRPPLRAGADALYDSSRVPHATRWRLALPSAAATRADLQAQLLQTLALLAAWPAADTSHYFFRLTLLHEDMHHEAALHRAQALGIRIADARWQSAALSAPSPTLRQPGGSFELGTQGSEGFGFDNEFGAHAVQLQPFEIDAQVLRWAEFLPFIEAGGYADERWWTRAGSAWRQAGSALAPRYLRRYLQQDRGTSPGWQSWRHGQWQPLALHEPACHLTLHEAQAWCRWAGRRLPTEAEWECAALAGHDSAGGFRWGDVWEWTATAFAPYPGFGVHPYRDYSAPWFDGRPVLRGASYMTQPRLRHARYRNFFAAERNDVPAGFRSCAL